MYLISPLVVGREVDVVDEDDQLLAGRGSVGRAHPLVHVALDAFLRKSVSDIYINFLAFLIPQPRLVRRRDRVPD